ncbi:cupin domain-containing protein [Ponticoccus sp. SC2-23]|uniref:cupin domain-containing protein n=1 Tax=Alexandriicola marinus TaxID=2081710 RepID=UPI000FDBBF04|nr:cupin domain-containing protein [Alexandriicola marinus]MBM1218593.1 cupin domain-containing protein [Ponticoccus sp. SC6-9]MBM1224335.1 cupin domain-containing protein [Ponticoccus sp. SC6-15]MBM1229886.1 cupin domain-containing protein [Ponticoccus sp. SC6-38]MBM1233301.1 cupin domain-containing protein [Ponticoccus sp. SC6-45]MBM1236749.1 cupin domain-containing protein [Ponticoccus sp. SC6-49]MBM1242312.1 cupin domain-containing protein [Ponticoccus sp. SC2-64]MBM1246825.1 cupin domai
MSQVDLDGQQAEIGIGVKLRHTRKVKGLTLKQLADAAGCSESLLSKIENGRATPSLKMLQKLSSGLEMTVGQMFAQAPVNEGPVTKANERTMIHADPQRRGNGLMLERLIPYDDGHLLQGNIHHIEVGGSSEGALRHEGEEFGYVLNGRIELLLDDRVYALEAGDSFCFRSERSHGYRNVGDETARVIWLNTPPSF